MSTNYPVGKDDGVSLPNPNPGDLATAPDHAGLHSSVNAAIIALETKVGIRGDTTPGTLDGSSLVNLHQQTGTVYTLAAADAASDIEFTNVASITITIPDQLGTPNGSYWNFRQMGAGTPIVVATGAVVLVSPGGVTPRTQYSTISLLCNAANSYVLSGDLALS